MPEEMVKAMDRQTAGMDRLTHAFERSRRLTKGIFILGVIELLAVILSLTSVLVILNAQHDTHKTLILIKKATSPQSQAQSNDQVARAVSLITVCTDNHTDRALAIYFHRALPARVPGCVADDLP